MTRPTLWKRLQCTIDVSPSGEYAILTMGETSYLCAIVDEAPVPLMGADGTPRVTTIGEAVQRIEAHKWSKPLGTVPS